MSLEAKRISPLTQEIEHGLQPLLISDVKPYKRNGVIVTHNEAPGVIVTFENPNEQKHQELYWIGGHNHTAFQKLLIALNLDPSEQHEVRAVKGKMIWGAIKSTFTMRGAEQIREDRRLVDTMPLDEEDLNPPPYHKELVEYRQEEFNQDNPAF